MQPYRTEHTTRWMLTAKGAAALAELLPAEAISILRDVHASLLRTRQELDAELAYIEGQLQRAERR